MMLGAVKALKRIGGNREGFTLVELLAVLAILAVVAAIAVPRFTGTIKEAKVRADKSSALIIARAAEQKWIDDGQNEQVTYYKKDLVPDYLREVKWQVLDADDFEAQVDEKGKCFSVMYHDGTSSSGTNLLED
ncbi:MAG: prepilin-type N-terminal cleavage/methylation domain-containing protein [Clostridiales bacterium]|jgi:type IV pilus assembly protein PilA|nr:prepilin-type N-terminal cleavage/methylation domain-containing protein [Clostridiales bacterium]